MSALFLSGFSRTTFVEFGVGNNLRLLSESPSLP